MKLLMILLSLLVYQKGLARTISKNYCLADTPLIVYRCTDFTVTGKGENQEWQKAPWMALNKIDKAAKEYDSKFKIMYSLSGIYVLFAGEDEKITSDFTNDFENLYEADVFEVFFHPEPAQTIYFEYEISPLDKELVLLIPNMNGKFMGWIPWNYVGKKKVVKKVNIVGGQMNPNASIKGWSAELFFPYELFDPLINVPPKSGMRWNANFCRLDYDGGKSVAWSWSPVKVSFHEFKKFYPIQFE